MGVLYLVLPTEPREELVLLLQQLFQQFSLCLYLDLEAVVFPLFPPMMMDFLTNPIQRLHH